MSWSDNASKSISSVTAASTGAAAAAGAGVAVLPPASLMRARTIGQIASLIAGHMGGKTATPAPAAAAAPVEAAVTEDVDLETLSDEDIDRLLGADAPADEVPDPK